MDAIGLTMHQHRTSGIHMANVALTDLSRFRQPAVAAHRISDEPLPSWFENPLIRAARPLLDLVLNIRQHYEPRQEHGLYPQVVNEIEQLESQLSASGLHVQTLIDFRYALCCCLDEAVMSQPWGHQGSWSSYSLLTRFHHESWGGEHFFTRLSELMTDPVRNCWVLQFFLLCLDLGYEGRYRILPQGEVLLRQLRHRLHQQLYPAALASQDTPLFVIASPQPQPERQEPPLSLGLYALALVLILTLSFLCYHQSLSQHSQQILQLLTSSLETGGPL